MRSGNLEAKNESPPKSQNKNTPCQKVAARAPCDIFYPWVCWLPGPGLVEKFSRRVVVAAVALCLGVWEQARPTDILLRKRALLENWEKRTLFLRRGPHLRRGLCFKAVKVLSNTLAKIYRTVTAAAEGRHRHGGPELHRWIGIGIGRNGGRSYGRKQSRPATA